MSSPNETGKIYYRVSRKVFHAFPNASRSICSHCNNHISRGWFIRARGTRVIVKANSDRTSVPDGMFTGKKRSCFPAILSLYRAPPCTGWQSTLLSQFHRALAFDDRDWQPPPPPAPRRPVSLHPSSIMSDNVFSVDHSVATIFRSSTTGHVANRYFSDRYLSGRTDWTGYSWLNESREF